MRVAGRINIKVNREAIAAAEGKYAEIAARYSVSETTVQRIKAEYKKREEYDLTFGGNVGIGTTKEPSTMSDLNSLWHITEQPEPEEEM